MDEYYVHSPSYTRSNKFAISKGLVSNAPGAMQSLTRGDSSNSEAHVVEAPEKVLRDKLEDLRV